MDFPPSAAAAACDLIGFLQALPECRMRRGIRFPHWRMLLVAILAILSGQGSLVRDRHRSAAPRPTATAKARPDPQGSRRQGPDGPHLRSKKGAAIYAQRNAIVEPVNGQIKATRGLLRGLEKVNGEWGLMATTYNLLKLFRFQRSELALTAATG